MGKSTKIIQCSVCREHRPHDARGMCHNCYARERRAGLPNAVNWTPPTDPPTRPPIFGSNRLPQRFWDKVLVGSATGCWQWTANTWNGYGKFSVNGRLRSAHVVAYTVLVGPVPEDRELDHLCHSRDLNCMTQFCIHRACCNPDHLQPVPHQVNMSRGIWAKKTHCPYGHPYSGDNLMVADGRRRCRTCVREQSRRRWLAKRAS